MTCVLLQPGEQVLTTETEPWMRAPELRDVLLAWPIKLGRGCFLKNVAHKVFLCFPQAQQRNVDSLRMEGIRITAGCWGLPGLGGTLVPVLLIPQGCCGAGPAGWSLPEYHEHKRAAQWKPVTQETRSARGGSSKIL